MEFPQLRPGLVKDSGPGPKVIAFFPNSAEGNVAIQYLVALGVPGDKIGVTPPDQIEGGQGMVLAIGCSTPATTSKVEELCRRHGAFIHRQRR
ncbi:MAG: hypothetical protein AB7I30_09755 [Isosphaeraceae bacterium]